MLVPMHDLPLRSRLLLFTFLVLLGSAAHRILRSELDPRIFQEARAPLELHLERRDGQPLPPTDRWASPDDWLPLIYVPAFVWGLGTVRRFPAPGIATFLFAIGLLVAVPAHDRRELHLDAITALRWLAAWIGLLYFLLPRFLLTEILLRRVRAGGGAPMLEGIALALVPLIGAELFNFGMELFLPGPHDHGLLEHFWNRLGPEAFGLVLAGMLVAFLPVAVPEKRVDGGNFAILIFLQTVLILLPKATAGDPLVVGCRQFGLAHFPPGAAHVTSVTLDLLLLWIAWRGVLEALRVRRDLLAPAMLAAAVAVASLAGLELAHPRRTDMQQLLKNPVWTTWPWIPDSDRESLIRQGWNESLEFARSYVGTPPADPALRHEEVFAAAYDLLVREGLADEADAGVMSWMALGSEQGRAGSPQVVAFLRLAARNGQLDESARRALDLTRLEHGDPCLGWLDPTSGDVTSLLLRILPRASSSRNHAVILARWMKPVIERRLLEILNGQELINFLRALGGGTTVPSVPLIVARLEEEILSGTWREELASRFQVLSLLGEQVRPMLARFLASGDRDRVVGALHVLVRQRAPLDPELRRMVEIAARQWDWGTRRYARALLGTPGLL